MPSVSSQAQTALVWVQADRQTLDTLKDLGAGRPAPDEVTRLYRQAFDEFGTQALWNRKASARPTIAQALVAVPRLTFETRKPLI